MVRNDGKTVTDFLLPNGGISSSVTTDTADASVTNTVVDQAKKNGDPASCKSWTDALTSPVTCFWRGTMSMFGAGLVWMASWLIVVAGMLFNWAIQVTILDFTTYFYTPAVNDAVATVWTNLRDIANIFIIGFFVFIAISIILGLQEFGQKKLIARVIIVSILINFSFLFTQIAINTSNFFAYQIIAGKAATLPITQQAGSATFSGDASKKNDGIAGEFLKFAGADTFGDTWTALSAVAENNQSGWVALLHGIMVAVLLLMAAGVLFYGAFLLLARGIVIIFLLMTSAFAFATYLSPSLAESEMGFKGWKDQLMRNVMLAPAMMLFLWASLNLAKQLSHNGTLGSLVKNPGSPTGIGALFSYLLIIGILYASLKISSSLSGMTGRLASSSLGTSGSALSRTTGFVGRATLGRIGMATAGLINGLQAKRLSEGKEAGAFRTFMENRVKGAGSSMGRSSFDAMNTKALNKAVAGMGGFTFGDKVGAKGRDGEIKELAKKAVERARAEGHLDDKVVREKAAKGVDARQEGARDALAGTEARLKEEQKDAETKHTDALRDAATAAAAATGKENELQKLNDEKIQRTATFQEEEQRVQAAHQASLDEARARYSGGRLAREESALRARHASEINSLNTRKTGGLGALDTKISNATTELGRLRSAKATADTAVDTAASELAAKKTDVEARLTSIGGLYKELDQEKERDVEAAVETYGVGGVARSKARWSGFGGLGTGEAAANIINDKFVNKIKGEKDVMEAYKHWSHLANEGHGNDAGGSAKKEH